MKLAALILYGVINGAMFLTCLLGKRGRVYEFPFWFSVLGLIYFLRMAMGQLENKEYPDHAYTTGLIFAAICSAALWIGFYQANRKSQFYSPWLYARFDTEKLIIVGIILSVIGFYFHLKLLSLPEEMLAQTQWSGATVKYLFLASIFKIGFATLWLVYLIRKKWVAPKILAFLLPGLLLLLTAAVVRGRRAAMMELVAYLLIGLWFARGKALSRGVLVGGLFCGMILINSIGTYRSIMKNSDAPLSQRLKEVFHADLFAKSKKNVGKHAYDFDNYIYYRQVLADGGAFNFGLAHWNSFVFNFVPGQLVGQDLKKKLMLPLNTDEMRSSAKERYGHAFKIGTTDTGFLDAYGSFGWFGFIKFWLIGWMMGLLYRHAMLGGFLAQLLYIYLLTSGMHAISHGTHQVLVSKWVYFLVLGYPALRWARMNSDSVDTYHHPYPEAKAVE